MPLDEKEIRAMIREDFPLFRHALWSAIGAAVGAGIGAGLVALAVKLLR